MFEDLFDKGDGVRMNANTNRLEGDTVLEREMVEGKGMRSGEERLNSSKTL